jgi:hypothetical protein
MRQKVKLDLIGLPDLWVVEEVQALARAIRGHPTITSFDSWHNPHFTFSDALYLALATLPALELINLSNCWFFKDTSWREIGKSILVWWFVVALLNQKDPSRTEKL